MLAFSNKTKTISAFVPDKVNLYLDSHFKNEISFFEKKYKFKININSDETLIIPEYKIHLFNKSKKIISKIENFKKINTENNIVKIHSGDKKKSSLNIEKPKKSLGRTLWVRRKKVKSN